MIISFLTAIYVKFNCLLKPDINLFNQFNSTRTSLQDITFILDKHYLTNYINISLKLLIPHFKIFHIIMHHIIINNTNIPTS